MVIKFSFYDVMEIVEFIVYWNDNMPIPRLKENVNLLNFISAEDKLKISNQIAGHYLCMNLEDERKFYNESVLTFFEECFFTVTLIKFVSPNQIDISLEFQRK